MVQMYANTVFLIPQNKGEKSNHFKRYRLKSIKNDRWQTIEFVPFCSCK